MYQTFTSDLSRLLHEGGNTAKSNYMIKGLYGTELPGILEHLLLDESADQVIKDAQVMVLGNIQLWISELKKMGSEKAVSLIDQHLSTIKQFCAPRFVDPEWIVDLHDLGHDPLAMYLSYFCVDLRVKPDSWTFEEIERLPSPIQKRLSSTGMKSIAQGYTYNFLNFSARVALDAGIQSSYFRKFILTAKGYGNPDSFAIALIRAIASRHETIEPVHIRVAVRSVWQLAEGYQRPPEDVAQSKSELTAVFRDLGVPEQIFAQDSKERDRLFSEDLGL